MKVVLLSFTQDPVRVCVNAAKQCYSPGFVGDNFYDPVTDKDLRLLDKVINNGHLSVLEHASFTFGIEGISRITSHQLVRSRIASFSQQSQRYTKYTGDTIIPRSCVTSVEMAVRLENLLRDSELVYNDMIEAGVPTEDARYFLLQGSKTNLVMTKNARELHHTCSLRCCNRAQWEIRTMFNDVATMLREKFPPLFKSLGPSCFKGKCPEGSMGCGEVNRLGGK